MINTITLLNMRNFLSVIIVVAALLSSCQKKTNQLSSVQEHQISDTLEKIAIDFQRSWESSFMLIKL